MRMIVKGSVPGVTPSASLVIEGGETVEVQAGPPSAGGDPRRLLIETCPSDDGAIVFVQADETDDERKQREGIKRDGFYSSRIIGRVLRRVCGRV